MPVELTIVESVTELETTVIEVVLESASAPGPAGPGVPVGGTDGQVLTKTSATDYATAWEDPTGGGGGAPADADYLVGTANGSLSAEIVVGTSPGGELGGTWASPTVDATHSGSSHASVQAAAEATSAAALAAHEADTTSVHGIADTSALALTANHPTNATFNDHSARHENGGADEISIAGLDGTSTELAAHLADTADAHDASAISILDAANDFTATDVEGALAEIQSDHETDAQNLADHIADTTAAHAASAISFSPTGSIAATDVQAAIAEVASEAGGGGAPTDATYITQTANGTLSNEQALSALSTGIVKVTTTTGVLSTAVANTDYAAAAHASRHQNGGADEISVAGLSGELADAQPVTVRKNTGADVGTRSRLNFIEGSNVTLTVADDAGSDEVDITIASSGGGGGGTVTVPIVLSNPRVTSLSGNSFFSVLGLTDWDAGHWEFVLDVEGKIYGHCRVPANYASGGTLKLAIAANATSGVTRLQVGTKAVADAESLNPTLTDETAQDITVPGTAYLQKVVSFSLTETLAAGDLLIVEIFHDGDHANDTLAVNTLLFDAWLEVTT